MEREVRKKARQDPPIRPQLYVSVLLVMLMVVLAYMGQWDWVLAVFIGMLVGNAFSVFRR
jgi:hypothetical protein